MAAPTVRAFATPTNNTDAAPAFTVSAPAGVTTGDLLIAFCAGDTSTTAWTASPANGWTRLANDTTAALQLATYAKVADGTDALSVAATNNNDSSSVMVAITVGTHGVTNVATEIVLATAANATSGNADPPATGTVAASDYLAFAYCAVDMTATGDSISAAPTNYTTGAVLTKSASSTSSVGLGVGHRALTAATSEDPGTFTNTSRAWIAKTLLVPPPQAEAVSPTDNIGITDSADVTLDFDEEAVNPVDPVGITDVIDLLVGNVVDLGPDAIGITDTADPVVPGGDQEITPVDNVGITDDVDMVLDRYIEADADPIGITDTATLTISLVVTATDNLGITDSVTFAVANVIQPIDNVGITDSVAFVHVSPDVVSPTDSVGITDSVTLVVANVIQLTDNIGITDSAAVSLQGVDSVSPVDGVGITDSVSLVVANVIQLTDAIGITDSASVQLAEPETISPVDVIGITDSASVVLGGVGLVNITVIVGPPTIFTRSTAHAMVGRSVGANNTIDRTSGVPDMVNRSTAHTMVDRDANDPEIVDRDATIAMAHGSPDPPTF